MNFVKKHKQLYKENAKQEYGIKKIENRTLSYYFFSNPKASQTIIFIHGSPGSKDAYAFYMNHPDLRQKYSLLAVDRPGYENSKIKRVERSLENQSRLLHKLIKSTIDSNHKVTLVGHSFGGPIIARIAMDYPNHYNQLIFLAASVSPDLEKPTWYQKLGNSPLFHWILPKGLKISSQEIFSLKPELEKIDYKSIKQDTIILHGQKDDLVPIGNLDFMKQVFINPSYKVYPQENHFIPWTQSTDIAYIILNGL